MKDPIECPYCHKKYPFDGDSNTTTFGQHFLYGEDTSSHGRFMINKMRKYENVPREQWPDWLEALFRYHGL